jgi:hypothetical protein
VREEEIDWCVYRVIADGDTETVSGVIARTHLEPGVVKGSLGRLIRAGLVDQIQERIRVLPFQQTLLHNQMQMEGECIICVENGVIKVKRNQENEI